MSKSPIDESGLSLPSTKMREIYPSSDRLVHSFKEAHFKSFAVDLMIEFIPVWWFAMEPMQWLTLNFADVHLVEKLCVLAVKSGIEGMVE